MQFTIIVLATLFMAGGAWILYRHSAIETKEYSYQATNQVLYNPLTGLAPAADYEEIVGKNTLVYVDVTFRELEPEEGVFDFTSITQENHLAKWKAEGKNVVFRLICDNPDTQTHMDIPNWLYRKTADGVFYDCEYGKGYAPNYANETLIMEHQKAVEALGKEFGTDSFFAYIELGSIGHWGEWHVNTAAGIPALPDEDTCERYVAPYLEAFPNAQLLMRRPFKEVAESELGVYNDMTGSVDDTKEWLNWIENGGSYEEPIIPHQLVACANIWEKSPIGGELTSGEPMNTLLGSNWEMTKKLLEQSHMTFIGPQIPVAEDQVENYSTKILPELLLRIGYHFQVTDAKMKLNRWSGTLRVTVTLKNAGVAPMYQDWPVYLYLYDEDHNLMQKVQADVSLADIGQNESSTFTVKFEDAWLKDACLEEHSNENNSVTEVGIGIENPENDQAEVLLDVDQPRIGKISLLSE